jgi:hypothetical protein|tara:strand:+ start:490 stop:900 length:411 start_codon:yes stop_codon:yes gene_type:complete
MILDKLCTPAILYIGFTLTHIVVDIFHKLYNTAILKFVLMIIFTTMLDLLCKSGLTLLSWIIVFMPFILLTTITVLLLFTLGLSPDKGFLKYKFANNDEKDEDNVTDNTTTEDIVIDEPSKTNLTSSVEVENMYNM